LYQWFSQQFELKVNQIFQKHSKKNQVIKFGAHALEELDNDDIEIREVMDCMRNGKSELISYHWEEPFKSTKLIFLLFIPDKPPAHVVLLLNEENIFVKTAYNIDYSKFKPDGKTRIR